MMAKSSARRQAVEHLDARDGRRRFSEESPNLLAVFRHEGLERALAEPTRHSQARSATGRSISNGRIGSGLSNHAI